MRMKTAREALDILDKALLAVESANEDYWTQDDISEFRYRLSMLDSQFYTVNGDKAKLKNQLRKIGRC